VVLAADTGRGKTSIALQIAAHAARQGKSVLYWTLEMPPSALFRRMVSQMTGVNGRSANPTFEQREAEREAVALLYETPVYFDRHSRTVAAFCASIRQVRSKTRLGLVVVDHIQLVRSAGRTESRTREVGETSRSLKLATLDFDLPFLVLSQFRRTGNETPTIHSLKESGDVENDADVILLMTSGELSGDQPTPVTVHIGKQREGPAGMDIPLIFQPQSQRFDSLEER
jgi:replicative DNA helicase